MLMKQVMRVVSCGELQQVPSQKAEGGMLCKRQIVLQEIGGKYEDQVVGVMLGNLAQCQFYPGEVVIAALRLSVREYNGQMYQDIIVSDLVTMSPNNKY